MDQELTEFLIEQFEKLPTREELDNVVNGVVNGVVNNAVNGLRAEMATKTELAELRSEMVTKSEFYNEISTVKSELTEVRADIKEVKVIVQRLDRRTDEDIRATMKDVEKIKTYLSDKGHQI